MVARSALVFAAGAVALWSTNALVGKSLLATYPVSLVQFLQFVGAALVFVIIQFMSRENVQSENAPRENAVASAKAGLLPVTVGFIGLVGTMVLQYIAFASMPVIEANLVAYTWPLMVAAAVIGLEHPRRPVLLGLTAALGFVGVALVISGGPRSILVSRAISSATSQPSVRRCAWLSIRSSSVALPPRRTGCFCHRP